MVFRLHTLHLRQALFGLLLFCATLWGASTAYSSTIHELRAQRRLQHKTIQISADKNDGPALFGLLVIPVDFSDTRLPLDYHPARELGPRLIAEDGESLHNYFQVASGGKLELRITTTPVIHLPDTRREYSDVGYNGFSRTRKLATDCLQEVKALGLEFRSLDMEGPDRMPGTADDDGQIDGILILHSGPGQENDPDQGLIQPLQYFLDEPVYSGGIAASFYAVASLHSGPGIWAHETGHLLGMEDRYDPLLHPDPQGVDVRSRGGLGRYSLMGSGAWGTGEGWGAALPDAYTSLQMGWYQARTLPETGPVETLLTPGLAGGQVGQIWTHGQIGSEYFLLESRDPQATAPFDSGLSRNEMLIYHVDESIPEGSWESEGPGQWHLRVNLVEADADDGLRSGDDDGTQADFFPGPLHVREFGPGTSPSSWGYSGNSLVHLTNITSTIEGVTFLASASDSPHLDFQFSVSGDPLTLQVMAHSLGETLGLLNCQIQATGTSDWGSFSGGSDTLDVEFQETQPGTWEPAIPILFLLEGTPPPGATTTFLFQFSTDSWVGNPASRPWIWDQESGILDFATTWPDQWNVEDHTEGTTWHFWSDPSFLADPALAVLVATGMDYFSPTAWPNILYQNRAHTTLTTPPLGSASRAVRIIHTMDSERLTPGSAMDGGRFNWLAPSGATVEARPLDDYTHTVEPSAFSPLAGRDVVADSLLTTDTGQIIWTVDLISVPENPGPWRLQLEFGANTIWRRKGWLVADLKDLPEMAYSSAFPVSWTQDQGLSFDWPYSDIPADGFQLQARMAGTSPWENIGPSFSQTSLSTEEVTARINSGLTYRTEVRVLALTDWGPIASPSFVVYPDGGFRAPAILGAPRPNPARNQVNFQVDIPSGLAGQMKIYDVRGRAVSSHDCPSGRYLMSWDGTGPQGRRLPAGVYILRLEGSGPVQTRKVVLLR